MNISKITQPLTHLKVTTQLQKITYLNIIFDLSGVLFNPELEEYNKNSVTVSLKPNNARQSIQLLNDCKKQGHKLFVVSNLTTASYEFLQADPTSSLLFSYFDDIILSDKVGIKKPDPRIFLYLLEKHKLDPRTCIFIDDQYKNLEAAQQMGINKTILCKNGDICQIRCDLQIQGAL